MDMSTSPDAVVSGEEPTLSPAVSETTALEELDNEDIEQANEEVMAEAMATLEEGIAPPMDEIEGAQAGRARAASAMTRMFGHFMAEKNPRATWVVAVLKLDKDPGGTLLRDTLWTRLLRMPRFRSQMVVSRFGGYWKELPEEELVRLRDNGYLWQEVCENGEAEAEDIDRIVRECNTWEYDRNLPLWRAQFCRKMRDGTAFLVVTINHGIGDGMSLIATLLSLADDPPDLSLSPKMMAEARKKAAPAAVATAKPKGPKLGAVTKAKSFSYGVFHGVTSTQWKPDPINTLSMPDVTKPSKEKRMATADAIDLEEMKQVKNRFPGATLNDVMMAVMTATIRAYLEEVGDPVVTNGNLVRGSFPINLRTSKETLLRNGDPMNKWSYGSFNFDFKYKTRVELVWKVKRQVDKIKVSPSPLIQYRLLSILTKTLPRRVLLDTLLNFANLTTAQLSNVPGPSQPIYVAGAKVEDLAFNLFTPVGLYFGIVTYNGRVTATVNVDGTTKCDPKQLVKHWKTEFEALKAEVEAFGDKPIPVPKYWF